MSKANRKTQPKTEIEAEIEVPKVEEVIKTDVTVPNESEVNGTTVTPEELILQYGNKSNAIRALSAEGKTRSEVAKLLGIRYQHVNNVLGQVLKRVIKKERDEAAAAAAATGAEAK